MKRNLLRVKTLISLINLPFSMIFAFVVYYLLPRKTGIAVYDYIRCNYLSQCNIDPEELLDTFGGIRYQLYIFRNIWKEVAAGKTICINDDVPKISLLKLENNSSTTKMQLSDLMKKNRPLVLNFGSCT